MWQLENIETRKERSTFAFDGRGKTSVTQLWDGNTQIINAIEHVNWCDRNFQFQVCDCGIVGCQPGGWVSVRRAGSTALILPAFQLIQDAAPNLVEDYFPPLFLYERGIVFVEEQFYLSHLCAVANFPAFSDLSEITSWEMAKIFQWEAPHQVLGKIDSEPVLLTDIAIASSEGSFIEQTQTLQKLVNNLAASSRSPNLRQKKESEQVILLYLDMAGFPQWQALTCNKGNYSLFLPPNHVIEIKQTELINHNS